MKLIKKNISKLYPLFLVCFYFFVRPQFRFLAQSVSNVAGSGDSYYWTLGGLEVAYGLFAIYLVRRFAGSKVFQVGKTVWTSFFIAIFSGVFVYWIDYFISGFVQGRAAVLSLFPREIPVIGVLLLVLLMVVVRPITEEVIFRGALVSSYFKSWPLFAEIWLPALLYVGGQFIGRPFSLGAAVVYLIPSLVFGVVYYRTRSLFYPILGHVLLNLYYTLPLLVSVFQPH